MYMFHVRPTDLARMPAAVSETQFSLLVPLPVFQTKTQAETLKPKVMQIRKAEVDAKSQVLN